MAVALHGWHPGEVAIQRHLGFADAVSDSWPIVARSMPDQHRLFHTSNLNFIPVTTIDKHGRPWASIMAGPGGEIGFVTSPSRQTLSIVARLWDGDPILETVAAWMKDSGIYETDSHLIAGLGIEFSTRRRNKFAGRIDDIHPLETRIFDLKSINCPKYINVRKLVPFAHARPKVVHQVEQLQQSQRLPQDLIDFILNADTIFVGSIYKSQKSTASQFPSHAGMNARGGLPGFIRVSPSDGRTIVLPDYSGNRFVSSLGNIEATGLVGFTIVSFTTGDILYLTGTAKNIIDALPLRQQAGTSVERSPYSPKIKYLVEESGAESGENADYKAVLDSAVQLSEDLAVFRFSVPPHKGSKRLEIRPGQAIVLDFMDWIGPPQYQHMSNAKPSLINDDRIRTWTVSSAHEDGEASWFELTMRELKNGAVTGALFDILRQSNKQYGTPITPRKPVVVEVVGITGDFYLGQTNINALWVAGGIGITPFLSMLSALSTRNRPGGCDITLALATREPALMVNLLRPLLANLPSDIRIVIDIFTHVNESQLDKTQRESQKLFIHRGRIPAEYWIKTAENKNVLICGPGGFGDSATEGLQAAGVSLERIQREGFY
ncbi:hypothetical protein N7509_009542 [Penicillium cosmopolitanum]|uniref:FAD-binding FR-type domain-containing protein n=1 Tax=Penicillium cosmopolitanum TaxID=1131564 RepID=A0A9W9VPL9_9EURO|nr:uncharacterized protein N7509_009542 [Penicillium cosmopolitanum]KAJ5387001.1 hypothetical protein N7509_009542 [Penicillium cosmopolitanum]